MRRWSGWWDMMCGLCCMSGGGGGGGGSFVEVGNEEGEFGGGNHF